VTLGAGSSAFSYWHFVAGSERGGYVCYYAAFVCQQLHGGADAGLHVVLHNRHGAVDPRVIAFKNHDHFYINIIVFNIIVV
jgi:hypothetical protein